MRIAHEKGIVNDVDSVNNAARTQGATKGLVNPSINSINSVIPDVETSHHSIPPLTNVNPKIYPFPPTPLPLGGVYTYPYVSPPIIPNPPITQVDGNLATIFTQSLPLQSSEELKKQERKKLEMMIQFEGGNRGVSDPSRA